MNDKELLAGRFEENRGHLRAVVSGCSARAAGTVSR
jgi:hypothetical protein